MTNLYWNLVWSLKNFEINSNPLINRWYYLPVRNLICWPYLEILHAKLMIFNHRISTFYPFLLSQEQGIKKHDLNHSNGESEMKEFVLVPKKQTASIIHTNIHCQILTFRISELVQFHFCKHSTSQSQNFVDQNQNASNSYCLILMNTLS